MASTSGSDPDGRGDRLEVLFDVLTAVLAVVLVVIALPLLPR
ncbi:hypothetical protein [Kribbella endophytica]